MAVRFLAARLTAVLAAFGLLLSACSFDPGNGERAFAWEPETAEERRLRQQAEALDLTIVEGGVAGFTLGAVIGGLTGGLQGAFTGARLGGFIGSASGAYVRQLQSDFADRERQLDQLALDLEMNNRDLEAAIATMRAVLSQQRAKLAAARASGNPLAVRRAQEQAAGSLATMNRAVEAATSRQSVLGEARTLLAVTSDNPATAPAAARYGALADRISAMRSIAATLTSEI